MIKSSLKINECPCLLLTWTKEVWQHFYILNNFIYQAMLPVVSKKKCRKTNSMSTHMTKKKDSKTIICAGKRSSKGNTTCPGDSGGPYVCKVGGVWELHGVVSYSRSKSCSSRRFYSVFANVVHFIPWIKKNIYVWGCESLFFIRTIL